MANDIINRVTRNNLLTEKQRLEAMPTEELLALYQQNQQKTQGLQGAMQNASDIFLQQGGIKPPQRTEDKSSDLNNLLLKELLTNKQELAKQKEMADYKQELESKDPYKQSQLEINKAILENIKGNGQGGELIYRDPSTGSEIPQEQALTDISQGKQYIINRRVASRQGVKEENISKPESFNTETAGLISFADTFGTNVGKIKEIVGQSPEEQKSYTKKWGPFGAARTFSKFGFLTPTGSDNEKIQLALQQLKKAAFGEGGKQLTPMEASIVFTALDPTGKSTDLWIKQLEEADSIIKNKAQLVSRGKTNVSQLPTSTQPTAQSTPTNVGQGQSQEDILVNKMLDQLGAN